LIDMALHVDSPAIDFHRKNTSIWQKIAGIRLEAIDDHARADLD